MSTPAPTASTGRRRRSPQPLADCRACPVLGAAVWRGIEPEAADRFQQARQQINIRRNVTLFNQGEECDSLFTVIGGSVVLGRANGAGQRRAVHLIGPGGTLGFRGLIDGGRHNVSAWCGMDSLLCRIPAEAAQAAFSSNPALEDIFMLGLADELGATQDRMLAVATRGVRDRLVLLLDAFLHDFAHEVGEGWLIATPVSRTDMAALAGMTPETLSRGLRLLQKENIAHFSRRHVLIPSRPFFRDAVGRIIGGDGSISPQVPEYHE